MIKFNFKDDVLPHLVAVIIFLIITIFFFNPVFFDNKTIRQGDIQQWEASSKALRDYREATGEEGLWAPSMFSGMPAYLVNTEWSNEPVVAIKKILSVGLPHPVVNIFWAFLSYYILLLAFRVRPMLAIAGAIAFGLSSYMIIGVAAGHNGRIGSIAFMPLVMAGIHLSFSSKRILGFAVTAMGLALHLRENHLQMTYYLLLIVLIYGLVQLIYALKEGGVPLFLKNLVTLIPAALLAAGTFFGQFWAITEYSQYSIRGKSELKGAETAGSGLDRGYAFYHSSGMFETMTLMIPNFYGGSSSDYLVQDEQSATYKALVQSGDNKLANQLAQYTSAYWGPQAVTAPYYGGAIMCFLFVIGVLFAERKLMWWLLAAGILGIMLSWGRHFETFNFFMFDYFPGYNKFRSVTFAIVILLFVLPLLAMLGLEKFFENGMTPATRKKLIIAFAATGGLCLLMWLLAGMAGFLRDGESQLPAWFLNALREDRRAMFRADALRSFAFIFGIFILLFFDVRKRISEFAFCAFLIFMVAMDLSLVDRRYFTTDNYQRKRASNFVATAADEEVLKDKGVYRVLNLQETFSQDGGTSYFHHSLGGYHGAKLRRYQDLYDSCMGAETNEFIRDAQSGRLNFANYGILNMLNTKYIMFGPDKNNIIPNPAANGNAWFVREIVYTNSPSEELNKVCGVDTRTAAVVDNSKFKIQEPQFDSLALIKLKEMTPAYLNYESSSSTAGLGVFSEIYYPKGWRATIDGNEVPILRVNYVLRALEIPAGNHQIEFRFAPDAYRIGNKVTLASSWVLLLVVVGSFGWALKKGDQI